MPIPTDIYNIIKNNRNIHLNNTDNNASLNALTDVVSQTLDRSFSVDYKDVKKYVEHGLSWNPTEAANQSLDKQLSDLQSGWKKVGNSLAQTVVSEIGLGTALGVSNLLDAIGQAIGLSDHDYSNPISAKLEEWQEKFKNDVAPIYADPTKADIFHGAFGDIGWWASNFPSVMSSLTLLLPSMMAVKGLKSLGEIEKVSRALNKVENASFKSAKWVANATRLNKLDDVQRLGKYVQSSEFKPVRNLFLENGATAALSRTMENYQESRQTYNDVIGLSNDEIGKMSPEEYQNFVDRNRNTLGEGMTDEEYQQMMSNKQEVAKLIAAKAADRTFKIDYLNTGWDILQLYALRNIPFKGFKNAKQSPNSVILERNARRYAGQYKTIEELKDLMKKRTFGMKANDALAATAKGGKLIIGAKLSEGAEEALNYVAQQEGLHLGKTMLGMEPGSMFWSTRMNDYWKAPELWESAFWGVAGGVVFQGLGSGVNKIRTALERKEDYERRKASVKPGETVATPTWTELMYSADKKRDEAEMSSRIARQQAFVDAMNYIRNGEHPYEMDSEQKDKHRKITKEEGEVLARRLQKDKTIQMALTAMDAGRVKQLKAYLESDEITAALAEQIGISKEQADAIRREDLKTIDEVQQVYDQQVKHINNLSAGINAKRTKKGGRNIPVEYLQIIARNNVNSKITIDDLNMQLEALDVTSNAKRSLLGDRLDPNVDYKSAVRLDYLTAELGKLQRKKQRIVKDKEKANTVIGQQEIQRLDKSIDNVKTMITNLNADNAIGNLLYAIGNSFVFDLNDKNEVIINEHDKDYLTFRKAITEKDVKALREMDKRLAKMTEADIQSSETVADTVVRAHNIKDTIKELRKTNEDLLFDYYRAASIQMALADENSKLVLTQDELLQEVSNLHNIMNEVRLQAISDAKETIKSLADKYTSAEIRKALNNHYNNKQLNEGLVNPLSNGDVNVMNEALDVLNLEDKVNENLYTVIDNILQRYDDVKAAQGKSSSKSENTNTGDNSNVGDNISEEGQKANSERENGTDEAADTPKTMKKGEYTYSEQPDGTITKTNEQGEVVSVYTPLKQGIRTYQAEDTSINDISNEDRYDKEDGVDVAKNLYTIKDYPIINIDEEFNEEVLTKGELVIPSEENELLIQQQREEEAKEKEENEENTKEPTILDKVKEKIQSTILPTGEASETPVETISQGYEDSKPQEASVPDWSYDKDYFSIKEDVNIELTRTIYNLVSKHKQQGIDLHLSDEEINSIKEQLIIKFANGSTDSTNPIVEHINTMIEYERENLNEDIESGDIEDFIHEALVNSRLKETSNNFADAFVASIDALIDKYINDIALEKIGDTYYINVESLARKCNAVTGKVKAGTELYNSLLERIKERSDLVIIDASVDQNISVLRKAFAERMNEIEGSQTEYGINFDGVYNEALNGNKERLKEIIRVVDNLQVGDKLETEVDDSYIYFKKDNVTIGRLPLPHHTNDGKGYYQVNEGWVTDIVFDGNNVKSSKLKSLFTKIFIPDTNESDAIKELRDIIYTFSYKKPTGDDFDALIEKFWDNKEIKKAKEKGLIEINNKVKQDKSIPLRHLSKLCKYLSETPIDNVDKEIYNEALSNSIDSWFDKVGKSYFTILGLKEFVETSGILLSNITEGSLNLVLPTLKGVSPNDRRLMIPFDALSDQYKKDGQIDTDNVKIGTIGLDGEHISGNVDTSNNRLLTDRRLTLGQTFVLLKTRNNTHEIVQAMAQRLDAVTFKYKSNPIYNLLREINTNFINIVNKELSINYTVKDKCDELENYLKQLIPTLDKGETITPLFTKCNPYIDENGNTIVSNIGIRTNDGGGNKLGFTLFYNLNGKSYKMNVSYKGYNPSIGQSWSHSIDKGVNIVIKGDNQTTIYNLKSDSNGKTSLYKGNEVKPIGEFINIINSILKENAVFNIGHNFVELDNGGLVNNKFVYRDKKTGEFVIKIGDTEVVRSKSYNDFVLNNGIVVLNTKPNEDNSNFNRFTDSPRTSQQLKIKIDNISPVEENKTTSVEEDSAVPDNLLMTAEVMNELENKYDNKERVRKLFRELLDEEDYKKIKYLDEFYDILPKSFIFANQYLSKGKDIFLEVNNKTVDTKSRLIDTITLQPGQVLIGKEWLDLANGSINDRKEAMRKLVHEGLHLVLVKEENKKYVEQIREIFDEFAESDLVKNDKDLQQYLYLFDKNRYYTNGKLNLEGLEEFLIESLTSKELSDALNNIKSTNRLKRKESLLQQIMNLLCELFGWDIKKGSLYQKEFQLLGDILNNKPSTTKKQTTTKEKDKNQLQLDFTETEEEIKETPKEEIKQLEQKARRRRAGENISSGLRFSRIKENNNEIGDTDEFVKRFPLNMRAKIYDKIDDGEQTIKCK